MTRETKLSLGTGISAGLLLLSTTAAMADNSGQSQGVLDPASPQAQRISDLWYIVLVPALLVLLLVGGAIIYTAFKFRRQDGDESMPRQIGGNNAIEFTWTLIPALILLAIFLVSVSQMNFLRNTPSEAADAMHIKIVARQWAWSFEYPGLKRPTFGELIIPAGEVVNLDLESKDVIHSWSVPRLGGRIDVIPGQHNHAWVRADQPGTYYGQCTEFCGLSHFAMTVTVRALVPQDFEKWYAQQKGGP